MVWSADGMEREVGTGDANKELSAEFGDLTV